MPTPAREGSRRWGAGPHSGRAFVTAWVVTVLVLWGSLNLAFRHWRSGYRERAAFGARVAAAAIDPMAGVVPAGESPDAWRRAVAETHAMLVTLTASNVLDVPRMRALGDRVSVRVARSRPETARAELASLWDEVESQAGPIILSRHPRPALLAPRRAVPKR